LKRAYDHWVREEYPQSWAFATEVLNEEPENPKALVMAGCVMRANGDVGAAMQLLRRAAALAPQVPNVWMHFGACLQDLHQYEDAEQAFRIVHKTLPHDPMPPANIAASFVQRGKAREAVEWADKSLALVKAWSDKGQDPALAERAKHIAHVSRSYGCLALGRWEEGWKSAEYLYGDTLTIRVYNPPEREEPLWDGSKGKTVVVQADQGLGDMIMFSQCIPEMVRDCKKVVIETSPRLVNLFQRNFPETDVYGTLKNSQIDWPAKYEIDAHTHLSFLGRYYRKADSDFPKKPYIAPNPEYVKFWMEWLEQFPKPWVGFAWRGGIQRTNEASRSMGLEEMTPLIEQGGTPICLAYQDVGREVAKWNLEHKTQIVVPPIDNKKDYDVTVALISCLDHVVTVTTTVAHACGALGKKAYVLVNQSPQWRYCYGGDHLVWYPDSLSLYRQKPGEVGWGPVINRLKKDREVALAA